MSTETPTLENDSDVLAANQQQHKSFVGIDAKGATHVHDPVAEQVTVFSPNGDVVHEQDLAGRTLTEWLDHVEGDRGWAHREVTTFADLQGADT